MRHVYWLRSLVVQTLDLRLDGPEFDSRLLRLALGRVAVFRREDHLCISPSHLGQLHLLSYMGREIRSTDQSAVMLCGWEVKAG